MKVSIMCFSLEKTKELWDTYRTQWERFSQWLDEMENELGESKTQVVTYVSKEDIHKFEVLILYLSSQRERERERETETERDRDRERIFKFYILKYSKPIHKLTLSLSLFVCFCLCMFVCLPICFCLSAPSLSFSLSLSLSICLCLCLSVCLSLSLSLLFTAHHWMIVSCLFTFNWWLKFTFGITWYCNYIVSVQCILPTCI